MKPIPFPTGKTKNSPKTEVPVNPELIEQSLDKEAPCDPELIKQEPDNTELNKESPNNPELNKETPENPELNKEMPLDVIPDNCVKINDKLIEIKPTKLKYFRNKMASAYNVIKAVPLNEFLSYDKGVVDPERDADQVLYDFLVAAFDDPTFVRDHYDDLTAEDVERVIKIFGRLNHIDEKEEQLRKNKEAQAKH